MHSLKKKLQTEKVAIPLRGVSFEREAIATDDIRTHVFVQTVLRVRPLVDSIDNIKQRKKNA